MSHVLGQHCIIFADQINYNFISIKTKFKKYTVKYRIND